MPLAANRFGPQILSPPFNPPHHQQHSHAQHQTNQHLPPRSSNLPSPSYSTHTTFTQGNPSSLLSPFTASSVTSGLAGGFAGGGGPGLGGGGTGLASQAAISGFAHGAQMQHQQQLTREALRKNNAGSRSQIKSKIRDVWEDNLEEEMQVLRDLVEEYPYISMDTEFPGIVVRPMGSFRTKADYHYQTLRCNVDLLRVIQLGVTLFSENGEMPKPRPAENPYDNNAVTGPYTWQFNFLFSPDNDMYNQDSINFLLNSGMDMDKHEKSGINPSVFGALLISSGLVLTDDVRWISFHSGYDFAYLVKLMFCQQLPDHEADYRKLLSIFFPAIYDIKYMIKAAQRNQIVNNSPLSAVAANILNNLGSKSGLQDLADELGIKRIGAAHQAGSDSLLTGKVFWDVKKNIFNGIIDDDKYLGQVWGLNGMGGGPGSSTETQSGIAGHSTPNLNGATIYSSNGTPSTPNNIQQVPSTIPAKPSLGNGGGIGQSTTVNGVSGAFGRFAFGKG